MRTAVHSTVVPIFNREDDNFFNKLDTFDNLCMQFIDFCFKTNKPAILDRKIHFLALWNFPNKGSKISYSDFGNMFNTLRDFKVENSKKDNYCCISAEAFLLFD